MISSRYTPCINLSFLGTLPLTNLKPFTWDDCKAIIASGETNKFRRWPSDLAKYMASKSEILKSYESMENFVLLERLHWSDPPTPHSSFPYTKPGISRSML